MANDRSPGRSASAPLQAAVTKLLSTMCPGQLCQYMRREGGGRGRAVAWGGTLQGRHLRGENEFGILAFVLTYANILTLITLTHCNVLV